jgi:hypothetical protein
MVASALPSTFFFPYVCHRRKVPDDLLIALNPEEDSSLPYLIRIPLGAAGIVLKTRDTWPRTSKLYCHRAAGWPPDAQIILRLPVRRCTRRGAAIDLILDRARENRSQFVMTQARGREMIFWQSPKTSKQARPGVHIPTARAHGQVLEILIDSGEKYPYRFSGQQATTARERLACGDYAVKLAGTVVAVVERKTPNDLISSMISGRMKFLMAELAELPRAAVVVEEGYGRSSSTPMWPARLLPSNWLRSRRSSRQCRSCSARPGRSPRNGPFAGSAHASMNSSSRQAHRRWRRASVKPWRRTPPHHRGSRSQPLFERGLDGPD